jgi:hypothetical protein
MGGTVELAGSESRLSGRLCLSFSSARLLQAVLDSDDVKCCDTV